jgi:hypothetical protein
MALVAIWFNLTFFLSEFILTHSIVLQLYHIHSSNSLVVLLQLAKAQEAIRFTLTYFCNHSTTHTFTCWNCADIHSSDRFRFIVATRPLH